ncbi:MAG: hypothetical protein IIB19_00225 [Chloroflexi bacterium]|nr:hypothetical protein [Chloroflexota bacterium]MCH7739220.1 hypothetical protein [Chloroflexota bacterium]
MDKPPGEAGEWVETLTRDFQDRLTGGLFETIYKMDDAAVDTLMEGEAQTCVSAFVDLTGLSVPMSLDSFLEKMQTSGPSKVRLERDGDVILWTELHQGKCVCPLVTRDVISLNPKLCICGAYWVKHLFKTVANTEVDVETIETVAHGAENCRFRITVKRDEPAAG